jgi:hypothetical protein
MNEIKLSVELVNKVLGYLGTRPYQEVFTLITEIQGVAKDQVTPPEVKEEESNG